MTKIPTQNESGVKISRGKVDSLTVYEVTADELDLIERGSPNSIFLNFSIFLLSIGISFLITIVTVKIDSTTTFTIFLLITLVTLIIGIFLLFLWFKNRGSFSKIISRIKARLVEQEKEDKTEELSEEKKSDINLNETS